MPITGSGWPGGYLTTDMVLAGIGDLPGSQIDFVGFGELIGAGDGVVGSSDSVIFPTEFWEQDVNKTATAISLSPSSTSLTNAEQTYSLTITSNGVGKLNLSNNFASPTISYFTGNETINVVVNDNSSLGQSARSLTIEAAGAANFVYDSHTLTQAGNPASITYTSANFTNHTSTGTQFTITKSSNVTFDSVVMGDSSLTLTLISDVGDVRTYGIEWTTGPSYSTSTFSTSVITEVTDGNSFLNLAEIVTIPAYQTVNHLGGTENLSSDGESFTITPFGEPGSTWSISLSAGAYGTTDVTTGTVGDSYVVTLPINTSGASRSMTITITDTTTNAVGNVRTYTQPSQIMAEFTVKSGGVLLTSPHDVSWDADEFGSGGTKTFVIKSEPNPGFSGEITTDFNNGTTDWEHNLSLGAPGTFVNAGTDISITPGPASGWQSNYSVRPIAANSSIEDDKTKSMFIKSVADATKNFSWNLTQEALVVETSYYHAGTVKGDTSNNPITSTHEIKIWSTSGVTTQEFRLEMNSIGIGAGWSTTLAGGGTFLNPNPSSNTYYTPTNWQYSGGYYYSLVYFKPPLSFSSQQIGVRIYQPAGCTSNMAFQATPTSSCGNAMGTQLWCFRQF